MRQVRTDLAMEAAAGQEGLPGVTVSGWETGGVKVTEVLVEPGEGARLLNKPFGVYVTLEAEGLKKRDPGSRSALSSLLAEEIGRLLPPDTGDAPVLVLGLGNRFVTPDALGPRTVERTLVTRHLFRELPEAVDSRMRPVCAIAPGVLGVTGLETGEFARSLVSDVKPACILAIDALAARSSARVGGTVQLTDSGIQPGSGVGNHRSALNRESLGAPVIALGVPTVVYAATIVRDALEEMGAGDEAEWDAQAERVLKGPVGELIVTPREVDEMIGVWAQVLACAINQALQPGLTAREISEMMD